MVDFPVTVRERVSHAYIGMFMCTAQSSMLSLGNGEIC